MLVVNSHLVEITLIGWRIPFGLCELLFLQHHYKVSEHDFFSPLGTKIYKGENVVVHYVIVVFHFSKGWI